MVNSDVVLTNPSRTQWKCEDRKDMKSSKALCPEDASLSPHSNMMSSDWMFPLSVTAYPFRGWGSTALDSS